MNKEKSATVQLELLEAYYADNAKKLHKTVDRILLKFGGLSEKDRDDFYSLANEVFVDVMRRYDETQPFEGFLYSCLSNKIMSEITRRNREKRRADRMCTSLDANNGEDDGCTLLERIADDFNMEEEIFNDLHAISYRLEKYLQTLSRKQKEVLGLLSYCYKAAEIQRMLHITQKEYADALDGIRSYEKIKILL